MTEKRPQNCGTGYCSCIECPYEPVKQEPVACEQCEELSADKARWYRMADMFEQQAQELKGVLRQALNLIEGEWPEGDEVAQPVVDKIKKIVGERHDI